MVGSERKEMNLLLVGRTGNGKSSTGNTIIGKDLFPRRTANDSSTDSVAHHSTQVDGKQVNVVDGTGIGDTGEDIVGGAETLSHSVRSIWSWRDIVGFHAIVFVLKFGVRFTKQEKDAVQCVKSMFGEDVFKRRGVIAMTYGDNFSKDETSHRTFEAWCRDQTGDFKTLCEECGYRCVLFNNMKSDREQQRELMSVVDGMPESYTQDEFNRPECKLAREVFLLGEEVTEKIDRQHGSCLQECEILLGKIIGCTKSVSESKISSDTEKRLTKQLDGLERRVAALLTEQKGSEKSNFTTEKPRLCSSTLTTIGLVVSVMAVIVSLTVILEIVIFRLDSVIALIFMSMVLIVSAGVGSVFIWIKVKDFKITENVKQGY
ncbi:unnamed protein product [Lymnaea stagnalis]|uniref:AIG1-type G domain-containing protein n=1 Tax=Lymnaea stagnalis TaxID=6523 RepID=A0AAV2HML3_LYMST